MSNQAVNSLALISARKTVEANDVLAMVGEARLSYTSILLTLFTTPQLLSTHLYCACQALDLRYLERTFRNEFDPTILSSLSQYFSSFLTSEELTTLTTKLTSTIWRRLEQTTSVDLVPRWDDAFGHISSVIIEALSSASKPSTENPIPLLSKWRKESAASAVALTRSVREAFWSSTTSPTVQYLGKSKALYSFVRDTVGVKARRGDVFLGKQEQTVGSGVSKIYEAVKSGKINQVLVDIMA